MGTCCRPDANLYHPFEQQGSKYKSARSNHCAKALIWSDMQSVMQQIWAEFASNTIWRLLMSTNSDQSPDTAGNCPAEIQPTLPLPLLHSFPGIQSSIYYLVFIRTANMTISITYFSSHNPLVLNAPSGISVLISSNLYSPSLTSTCLLPSLISRGAQGSRPTWVQFWRHTWRAAFRKHSCRRPCWAPPLTTTNK